MRVIQLAGYEGPYGGSFVPMMHAVADAVAARGWQPGLVLPETARGQEWSESLNHGRMALSFTPPERGRGLDRAVREIVGAGDGPAILHSHFSLYDVASAHVARRRRGGAFLWHLHSRAEPGLGAALRNRVKFRVVGRGIARVLCVAPNICADAVGRGAPRDRTELWPNAIDVERFPLVTAQARAIARRELRLPDDRPLIMHFGWDWERKGGDRFLAAAKLLAADGPLAAVTVGGGRHAEQLAAQLGIADSVHVLEPREDAQALHAAADVFVSPSRAEGMPFAMAEALASGVPVVASDIPGQALIGRGLRACRLVGGDPAEIAQALRELLHVDAEARAAAREHVESEMGLGAWAERLADLYATIAR
jgi:glycosyltransferase involved in cell wall biosynthesis